MLFEFFLKSRPHATRNPGFSTVFAVSVVPLNHDLHNGNVPCTTSFHCDQKSKKKYRRQSFAKQAQSRIFPVYQYELV